jgi:hypothetical protein
MSENSYVGYNYIMDKWTQLADAATLEKTIQSLKTNGIDVVAVDTGDQAKTEILQRIPQGAQVFTMSSETLRVTGIADAINTTGRYDSIRKRLFSMNRETQGDDMRRLGAAPDWAIGSAQAVTRDGHVMFASQTGSQLPAYASSAGHVIWVVGTQKIVKNIDEGFRRIYEHCLPLEGERAKIAYGRAGSSVNKVLIVSKEFKPGRITLIFVGEVLGF